MFNEALGGSDNNNPTFQNRKVLKVKKSSFLHKKPSNSSIGGDDVDIYDPIIDSKEVKINFHLDVKSKPEKGIYDLSIITVPHNHFRNIGINKIRSWSKNNGLILDLKNTFPKELVDYTV